MNNTISIKQKITESLVLGLIAEQFPMWSNLPIVPIEPGGIDNKTFSLGEDMLIRLPRAEDYAEQVLKEQKWLPILASHLSLQIPKPLGVGEPSEGYPWNWSIYKWIEGKSTNNVSISELDLPKIAIQLAKFLKKLHIIDTTGAPEPGFHNYWRGAHPSIYDSETRAAIKDLKDVIDRNIALSVWEKATDSEWQKNPVWIHGDFAQGNILVKDNKVNAIIDFGCMGTGDPACDLVISWTFLSGKARKNFENHISLDSDTWARARGWALWKASFELIKYRDEANPEALKQLRIINEICQEYKKK